MKILGIESSCDETAAAVVENGVHILSNIVVSQIDIFAAYGGVIPEIAARSHLEAIQPVIDKALRDANCTWQDIDAISVTHAPGLLGSLLIGTLTARTLAILHNKPLYAVHHLKSHIYANWLHAPNYLTARGKDGNSLFSEEYKRSAAGEETPSLARVSSPRVTLEEKREFPSFPLLSAILSGGHTQLICMEKHNAFEIIGTTTDDAIGECFDKVAKILGLPYPGGPAIAQKAEKGNPEKYPFPHPKTENPLNFSFSGLKTAVLRLAQKEANLPITTPSKEIQKHLTEEQKSDIAASFQKVAIDIILEKLQKALELYPETKSIVFAGGVSANQKLRKEVKRFFSEEYKRSAAGEETPSLARVSSPRVTLEEKNPFCFFPSLPLSGDNAAMVATAAFFEIQSKTAPTDPYTLNIYPRIEITKS